MLRFVASFITVLALFSTGCLPQTSLKKRDTSNIPPPWEQSEEEQAGRRDKQDTINTNQLESTPPWWKDVK